VVEADAVIKKIFEQDPRRAYIAFKYLDDMRKNLAEVYSALRDGGRYIIVVGNNRIRGQLFESWKYLMTLAENIGFDVENYFGSEIIKHFIKVPREERINTDWILVLRK
jgi:SAM-dependent methyltransferase